MWINLHDMVHLLPRTWTPPGEDSNAADFYFLWASERSGFSQLYLHKYDSVQSKAVNLSGEVPIGGGGDWVVER